MTRLTLRSAFPEMAQVVKPGQRGVAKVEHFTVTVADSKRTLLYASIQGDRYGFVEPGEYASLKVNGNLMMTDTHMERVTNAEFHRRSHGRVLIGGLGLGMVIHGLMQKPEVQHVTVVEKYQDVADLIGPSLRKYGWLGGWRIQELRARRSVGRY